MAGETVTDSNGQQWTGYGANWDEAMVLKDVDQPVRTEHS